MRTKKEPTEQEKAVGLRLRVVRDRLGLSRWQAVQRVVATGGTGMSDENLRLYEKGENQMNFLQVEMFARAYGMDPVELYDFLHRGELESVGGGAELTTANAGLYLSDLLNERAAALAASDPDRVRVAEVDIISKADNCTTRHMRTRSGGRNAALVPSQAMA